MYVSYNHIYQCLIILNNNCLSHTKTLQLAKATKPFFVARSLNLHCKELEKVKYKCARFDDNKSYNH